MANGRTARSKTTGAHALLTRARSNPLPSSIERRIATKVSSGLYASREEVLTEGLRLLEERDRIYGVRLTALRRDVREALVSLDAGEGVSADEVFAAARQRARATRRRLG